MFCQFSRSTFSVWLIVLGGESCKELYNSQVDAITFCVFTGRFESARPGLGLVVSSRCAANTKKGRRLDGFREMNHQGSVIQREAGIRLARTPGQCPRKIMILSRVLAPFLSIPKKVQARYMLCMPACHCFEAPVCSNTRLCSHHGALCSHPPTHSTLNDAHLVGCIDSSRCHEDR
jgi:hypothetical protein